MVGFHSDGAHEERYSHVAIKYTRFVIGRLELSHQGDTFCQTCRRANAIACLERYEVSGHETCRQAQCAATMGRGGRVAVVKSTLMNASSGMAPNSSSSISKSLWFGSPPRCFSRTCSRPHRLLELCSNGCAIARRKRFDLMMAMSVERFVSVSLMYEPIHLGSLALYIRADTSVGSLQRVSGSSPTLSALAKRCPSMFVNILDSQQG